jgi:hypothetical protein
MITTQNEAQHQAYSKKIIEFEQFAQSTFKQTPEIPYLDFYYKALYATAIQHSTTTTLTDATKQFAHTLTELLRLIPTAIEQHALQTIFQHYCGMNAATPVAFRNLGTPKVAIVGAGLAGLFAAYVLTQQGIVPEIFESRSNDDARLRPQNISFKEADTCIKPILAKKYYDAFFERGGAMDGASAKLRLTTGTFQDVLTEALLEAGVRIHFDSPIHDVNIFAQHAYDAILIAAGVHSCECLALQPYFHPLHFPAYAARGRTALCIAPSNEPHGYQRSESEGWGWQRNNKSVFSGKAFQGDLERLIKPLRKTIAQENRIAYLSHLATLPSIEYTFNFGNNTPHFMREATWPTPPLAPNRETYIVKQWSFYVEPMITTQVASEQSNRLLIAIGDANGSAHPLAALGTIKFCRNAPFLPALLRSYVCLKNLSPRVDPGLIKTAISQLTAIFHHHATQNTQEVFWANICCSLFSRER